MADALYLLTLRMTEQIAKVMNQEEKKMVETAAFFVSICYGPWFLKSYFVDKATCNDLVAYKAAFIIRDQYPKLGAALINSMQNHNWYLEERMVLLALADDDVEEEEKMKMITSLVEFDVPDEFSVGKPKLPVVSKSTELNQLVGPQSWLLLKVADVPDGEVVKWIKGEGIESFAKFKLFVKQLTCVNDCAERNIRLIQDFISGYKSEDMKQNLMLVAKDNRKKLKKECSKNELKLI